MNANKYYAEVILTIIAILIAWCGVELCGIHDSIKYDFRPEKNIHFYRTYDVGMFSGSNLDIVETSESSPFEKEIVQKETDKNINVRCFIESLGN